MATYICGGGKYGGEGGELHGGAASIGENEGEHHIRPGHCVKVKVSRLHCKAMLVSSALQSQKVGMGQQDFQVRQLA